jgi:carboxymethylenebutenolidase
MEITTEQIDIPLEEGGSMGGYLARPTSAGFGPAVLVFMEIFGINAHIRDVTERVARESYVALAPDFFHRTRPGADYGYDDEGFAKGMELLNALAADEMVADAQAALAYLRSRDDVDGDRIGCLGFCIGGHMAYLTACETDVKAAASFYGGGITAPQGPGGAPSTAGRTQKIRGKVLCLFGGRDSFIPRQQVDVLAETLRQDRVRNDIVIYETADHGFFCDQRDSYHAVAAKDAWERVKRLFSEELAS